MNRTPSLSKIGKWTPIDESSLNAQNTGQLLQYLSALLPLPTSGQYGIILAGNAASGGFTSDPAKFVPIRIAILLPASDGQYSFQTHQLVTDPVINGTQSIIVTDLNGDRIDDIFMSAENEMPMILKASMAYLSRPDGTYQKVTLDDKVINHSVDLVQIDGVKMLIGTSYPLDVTNPTIEGRGTTNPIYTYVNGEFKTQQTDYIGGVSSGTLGRFGPQGAVAIVRGDVVGNWQGDRWGEQNIVVYPFDGKNVNTSNPIQKIVPYLSTLPEYRNFPATVGGAGLTHTYELWSVDMNHDGRTDVLASQTMWSTTNSQYPTALQILMNDGSGKLQDATARLNPDMRLDIDQLDYNPTFLDVDDSGIQTLFFGALSHFDRERQSNYMLLNDGTGRLHVALHDEFRELATPVADYINAQYQAEGYYADPGSFTPKFIPAPRPSGAIDYMALVKAGRWFDAAKTQWQDSLFLVDVPMQYNPAIDYTRRVEITDRNQSSLMRTWAGDDLFSSHNPNPDASVNHPTQINGGAGTDRSAYGEKLSDYRITFMPGGDIKVDARSPAAGKIHDRLKNVEHLQFVDFDVNVTTRDIAAAVSPQSLQRVIELYVAFFNRTPDADGLAYWLGQSKSGTGTSAIADSFYSAGVQYTALTGFSPSMSNGDFVNVIYRNVLGRKDGADAGGLSYWSNELATGTATRGSLVSTMLDSAHSFKGHVTWGWVADLLDNKIAVAKTVAVDWGLNYLSADASIANGMAIAKAVTPTDTHAAIALVGVPSDAISL